MREVAEKFSGQVEARIYHAGRDVDYLRKYGPVMRGTLFIDERVKIDHLSRSIIEKAIAEAVESHDRGVRR